MIITRLTDGVHYNYDRKINRAFSPFIYYMRDEASIVMYRLYNLDSKSSDIVLYTCTHTQTHTVASPPKAVLAVGTGGAMEVGESAGKGGGVSVTPPVDLDMRGHVLYWYSSSFGAIFNKSLDGGEIEAEV